jgi:hypothetical protein
VVKDTGETLRAGAGKPVNTPEPVSVAEDAFGLPASIKLAQRLAVKAVEDRWRIDDEWWRREPVSRVYYAVLLSSGQRTVIYKDLTAGGWYRQTY